MIPPLVRRCPECGRTTWSSRFEVVVTDEGARLVECPSCGCRIETVDDPMLK